MPSRWWMPTVGQFDAPTVYLRVPRSVDFCSTGSVGTRLVANAYTHLDRAFNIRQDARNLVVDLMPL